MKRYLALCLGLLTVLSLTACGASAEEPAAPVETPTAPAETPAAPAETPAAPTEAIPEASEGTKTLEWFMNYAAEGSYTIKMKSEFDGMTTTSINAYDGDSIYSEAEAEGVKSISIIKDDAMYVLDPSTKMCIKMGLEMAQTQEIFADEAENYAAAVSSGEMTVKDVNCFYEEFSVEGESIKYCFDGDELRFMLMTIDGSDCIMEILSAEKGADPSLFEIPADYSVMEF